MSTIIRRGALVAALASVFVVAVPLAASAHVGVSPDAIPSGQPALLVFSVSHGCGDSPTTSLRVTIPEEVRNVRPSFDGDWSVHTDTTAEGAVSAVTFTAVRPVPVDLRGAVGMAVVADADAGERLAFPVEQRCTSGVHEWTQLAEDGEDPHALEAPAPVIAITDGDGHGGHGDHDAEPAETAAAAPAPSADAGSASASPVPLILGGAGLAVGAIALLLAIAALRRRG